MIFSRPRGQRVIQAISAILYTLLLMFPALSLISIPPDLFLRMDPVIAVATPIATRSVPAKLWIGIILLFVPFLLGRVFCGWVCPMGIAIDLVDWIKEKRTRRGLHDSVNNNGKTRWRWVKYAVLAFCIGSALGAITTYFYVSPLSLITRFSVIILYPLFVFLVDLVFAVLRPVFEAFGWYKFTFLYFKQPLFYTNFAVFSMVGTILALSIFKPRFWCRYLCPSGALLGLFSRKPLIRRHVDPEKCIECGLCQKNCPMGAIPQNPMETLHEECLSCLKCSRLCPEEAIHFSHKAKLKILPSVFSGERRRIVLAGVGGLLSAFLFFMNPDNPGAGKIAPGATRSRLVRPPGSIPEKDFLRVCTRCSECIMVCPTNTLQPIWLMAGLEGLWSPRVVTFLAPCSKDCAACGKVCPTGAIRALSLEEKRYCKIGTARIYKTRCLAWEQDRKCLVCDEVCPYDAVTFISVKQRQNRVPLVDEKRCSGCGYCETHCPVVGEKAIVVDSWGEIRLSRGSYKTEAEKRRLILKVKEIQMGRKKFKESPVNEELPPGFDLSK